MIGNLATKLCGRTSGSNELSQVTSPLLDFKTKKNGLVWRVFPGDNRSSERRGSRKQRVPSLFSTFQLKVH